MPSEFAIVDLFAGPGGLAEGFSSILNKDGSRPFKIALSVEKETSAFETLRFRSFFRQFNGNPPADYYRFLNGGIPEPDWESLFPVEWKNACLEAVKLELGSPSAAEKIDERLAQITKSYGSNVILIGGPPCQAYSLVGRARNKGTEGYEASKDPRHFLYKEYIRILQKLKPAAFVMENVNNKKYVAHGFWFGSRNADEMQMPVTDQAFIEVFRKQLGITRTTESGLSLAIPFVNEKITEEVIVRGVIGNYYFPILAGRLVVEVGSSMIDAKSFGTVAKQTMIGQKDNPDRYNFVEQVSARLSNEPTFEAKLQATAKSLATDQFDSAQVSKMKESYGRGELVHVRMPVRLRRKDGEEKISYVDLFMRPPPENSKPFVLFARGSITVPGEARYFSGANAYGAFVARQEDIVSFLGDAENPAHTTWSGTAEKLNANWRSPAQTLRFLRYALWDLYTIVSDQGDRKDEDALIDFFSLEDLTKSERPTKGKTTGVPPNLTPSEKAFRIQKRGQGGFAIVPGPGVANWEFPKSIRVRVAYDVLGANPFNKHSPLDFDLTGADIEVETTNMSVTSPKANVLELSVTSPEFLLEAKGFDTNRDLVVDAKARP